MLTRLSAIGLILAFLTSCATSPASGDSHGSDLAALVTGVETLAQPREPAGNIKRAEDVSTNGEAWTLLLDLEDVDWLHEQDKERIVEFVQRAVARIQQAREPCGWWRRTFRPSTCRPLLQNP